MKRRVLLVDDELTILLTLRAILEMRNFEVDTAASAREAEKKLKSNTYEMVITDMRMESDTAGYDVIRAARQQPYDPATAIVTAFPSGYDDWQSRGAQSLLVKPVNAEELLLQVENVLTTHDEHKLKQAGKSAKKVTVPASQPNHSRAASKKAL